MADGGSGLQVIDISDPVHPSIIGSVDTPDYANNVAISGTKAYVADGGSGLQVIDISDPAHPLIIGSVDTPGYAESVAISGNKAYIADGSDGLIIVPLPVEITPITVKSPTSITCTLPSPQIEGNYTIRVFNQTENYELAGAVTFLQSTGYQAQKQKKAIIVAGGGPYEGNNLWKSTQLCANFAYKALLYQGYTKDRIYYLSPDLHVDVDGNGQYDDIDADATIANLQYAITTWCNSQTEPAEELLLYITNHGGNGTFRVNASEILKAADLNSWLNSLQANMNGKVIFIYDACQSGTFISQMTPPAGKNRLIFTSALNENAIFSNDGTSSFSFQFWANIFGGADLYNAFVMAKNMVAINQTASLDFNGNGIPNEKEDKTLADTHIVIGRGYVPAGDMPYIGGVSKEQTLSGEKSAAIQAERVTSLNGIKRVWAVITPPGYSAGSNGTPVMDMPTVDLASIGNDTYSGAYSNFTLQGTYQVAVYASNLENIYSLPKLTTVIQTQGSALSVKSLQAIDFNGDGKSDILWKHKISGKIAVWLMNGTAIQSYDITGEVSDLNWEIIKTGDFNGDGKTDFLWRHKTNGKIAVWLINGTAIQSYDITGEVSDLNWEIINIGDFNGDGKTDLLWKHKLSGKIAVWLMNGTAIQSYDITGEVSDLNWEIINIGDFNGDGKADLLWKHKLNGKIAVWLMNGTAIQSYNIIGEVSDINWEIIK